MFLALQPTQPNCFLTKNACDSREELKMRSNSIARVAVLSCMTLLKLVKTTAGNLLSQKCVFRITTAEVKPGTRGWCSSKDITCCQPGFRHTVCSCKTSGSCYWFVLTALEVQVLSVSLLFHIINYLEKRAWCTDKACYGENCDWTWGHRGEHDCSTTGLAQVDHFAFINASEGIVSNKHFWHT